MDSLTHLALGAAVGEAVLGRKIGNRAMLWGAVCGTVPDLDVFIPFGDPVANFIYHRSASHSLLVLAALTPLMVWLIGKLQPPFKAQHTARYALVYLAFASHVLLDSLTVYGTQIFWPVSTTPMTWSTIFIIDPLYTVPLLGGVLAALVMSRRYSWGHRLNSAGLALSTLYLAWSLGIKLHVENITQQYLAKQGIDHRQLLTTPAPFTTLLWRVVVMNEAGYYEGFYSLLDDTPDLRLSHYTSQKELLHGIEAHWPVQRLQWFTKGFYAVTRQGRDIVITDLRMGLEPDYVFRFKVGEISNPHAVATDSERISLPRNYQRLRWVWQRVWRADADTHAVPNS